MRTMRQPATDHQARALSSALWLRAARRSIDALDARLLLQAVTRQTHAELMTHPESMLSPAEQEHLDALLHRRASGEPLAYLLGSADFHGRRFQVSPAVLVPRPETEELAALALSKLARFPGAVRVLDLGTGSGVLAVTLSLEHPAAELVAVDLSTEALKVARANAATLGASVRFLESDWFLALADERFHLIVANPPYIAADDAHLEGDGLCFEPRQALIGGADGLAAIRVIISAAPAHLHPGGWLLFEHGWNQGADARALLAAAGFDSARTWRDLSGQERISGGRMPGITAQESNPRR
ncbi:MAG: peptide chain release factor N(5)-glutamine methyltransferase [Zoogloeaceae bacterium]|nr:peptide chain release factor N(5)-glutamine methyltransferase [Zoogloeaceae bacterium]